MFSSYVPIGINIYICTESFVLYFSKIMFHCLINQTKSVAISSAIYERVNNTPNHSRKKYASTQFNSTSVKTSFSCFFFIVYWNACTYLANKYWLCCTVDYFSSYISMSGSFEVVICLLILEQTFAQFLSRVFLISLYLCILQVHFI